MKDLFDSKTNKMIIFGMVFTLLLILLGIAVLIWTNKDPTTLITIGIAKIFGDTGVAAYRNVQVDGPIRMQQASLDLAIKAKEANVDPMVWTPPTNGGSR